MCILAPKKMDSFVLFLETKEKEKKKKNICKGHKVFVIFSILIYTTVITLK